MISANIGQSATTPKVTSDKGSMAFTFGDPVPVLDKMDLMGYIECVQMQKWYEPPISLDGLTKSLTAAVHHSSPIFFKRDILASCFIPHKLLSRDAFRRWALDYLVLGNGYLELREGPFGMPLQLNPSLAKYPRRGIELDEYWFVKGWQQEHQFPKGKVHHLIENDLNQEIYGVPQYMSALNSAWLNESATLFRRKYYQNGSHAGFILYLTDTAQSDGDIDNLRKALKDSKGPGNFRNLFVYSPGGKKDGMQIIPVSEVAAKDEIFNIKNVTRDDMLAAHRVPPQLMGIIPTNSGGFTSPDIAAQVFARNELEPLQNKFLELNDWMGKEVVRFKDYDI
ncbi:MAG: bacteriophage p2 gpq capsid protein [Osedax symbiont Rs2]|nr:MAG: bacteriophage p2 gpq capsid protein [Osedax symbiont Rs2]